MRGPQPLEPIFTEKKAAPAVSEKKPVSQAPTEKTEVEKRQPKKLQGTVSTPSIKEALAGKTGSGEITAREQHEVYSNQKLTENFTDEQFQSVWNRFLDSIDSPTVKTTLAAIPEFSPDYRFILKIGNSVQEGNLKIVKPKLIAFLRSELKNSSIEIVTEIAENKSERIIYSDDEKYEEMVKQNPDLHTLRQVFNLDFGE